MRRIGLTWHRWARGVAGALGLIAFAIVGQALAAEGDWSWTGLPATVAPPHVPAGNPMSPARIALGRALFYEPGLSRDSSLPCAGCHVQARGFTDGAVRHIGVSGELGTRNVPGLANVAWRSPLTWADPKITSLEQQALVPMLGDAPVEMGMHGQDDRLIARLMGNDCYKVMFARAFASTGGRIDIDSIAAALAAFERTLLSFDSPYDRALDGDTQALSPAARAGGAQFARIGCAGCHSGRDLTDNQLHYTGTEDQNEHCGYGMRDCDENERPTSRFRTPSLRNVAVTGPWMHDGASKTMEDAIRRHAAAALVEVDVAPLLAFLDAQTDSAFLHNPAFSKPPGGCALVTETVAQR